MHTLSGKFWGCGFLLGLGLSLSGCYMDDTMSPPMDRAPQNAVMTTNTATGQEAKKNSAVREPVQQAAPGPKHSAAPQLPVLQ